VGSWDKLRLGRAVEALLENAFIYGPAASPVSVQGTREGQTVVLTFSGAGSGPNEEETSNLFTLFYRGASAGQAGQPGSGLGLYTARGIARAHGGDVHFAPGGLPDVFKMVLPLADAP
jgi:signal transduction histidine kinase